MRLVASRLRRAEWPQPGPAHEADASNGSAVGNDGDRSQAHLHDPERGAALVEMAIVLPLLMMLLMGIMTGGIAIDHKIAVTNASREAARYGATVPSGQCTPTTACNSMTWAQLVQSLAVQRGDGLLATSDVCVALVNGPGSAPVAIDTSHTTMSGTSPCFVDNSADSSLRVQVGITHADQIQAVFWTTAFNLTSQAVLHFEQ